MQPYITQHIRKRKSSKFAPKVGRRGQEPTQSSHIPAEASTSSAAGPSKPRDASYEESETQKEREGQLQVAYPTYPTPGRSRPHSSVRHDSSSVGFHGPGLNTPPRTLSQTVGLETGADAAGEKSAATRRTKRAAQTPALEALKEPTPGIHALKEPTPGIQASKETTPAIQAFKEPTPGILSRLTRSKESAVYDQKTSRVRTREEGIVQAESDATVNTRNGVPNSFEPGAGERVPGDDEQTTTHPWSPEGAHASARKKKNPRKWLRDTLLKGPENATASRELSPSPPPPPSRITTTALPVPDVRAKDVAPPNAQARGSPSDLNGQRGAPTKGQGLFTYTSSVRPFLRVRTSALGGHVSRWNTGAQAASSKPGVDSQRSVTPTLDHAGSMSPQSPPMAHILNRRASRTSAGGNMPPRTATAKRLSPPKTAGHTKDALETRVEAHRPGELPIDATRNGVGPAEAEALMQLEPEPLAGVWKRPSARSGPQVLKGVWDPGAEEAEALMEAGVSDVDEEQEDAAVVCLDSLGPDTAMLALPGSSPTPELEVEIDMEEYESDNDRTLVAAPVSKLAAPNPTKLLSPHIVAGGRRVIKSHVGAFDLRTAPEDRTKWPMYAFCFEASAQCGEASTRFRTKVLAAERMRKQSETEKRKERLRKHKAKQRLAMHDQLGLELPGKLEDEVRQMERRGRDGSPGLNGSRRSGLAGVDFQTIEDSIELDTRNRPVPQVRLVNGQVVLDETVYDVQEDKDEDFPLTKVPSQSKNATVVDESEELQYVTTTTYSKKRHQSRERWSAEEESLLMLGLSWFGTDFYAISRMFHRRTRAQIVRKFKKLDKQDSARMTAILRRRRPLDVPKYAYLAGIKLSHLMQDPNELVRKEVEKRQKEREEKQRKAMDAGAEPDDEGLVVVEDLFCEEEEAELDVTMQLDPYDAYAEGTGGDEEMELVVEEEPICDGGHDWEGPTQPEAGGQSQGLPLHLLEDHGAGHREHFVDLRLPSLEFEKQSWVEPGIPAHYAASPHDFAF